MNAPFDKFEATLSSFTDAVVILDSEKKIEWVNTAAEQLFGSSIKQLTGKGIATLFPRGGDIYAEVTQSIEKRITLIDHDALLDIGKSEAVSVAISIHPVEHDSYRGVALVLRNTSRLKALENSIKLHERVSEIAVLAAGIAHEIKNPLSGVRGSAQLLSAELTDEEQKSYTDLIIRESDRIDRLLMDLFKLDQSASFKKEALNIYTVLDEVVSLLRSLLEEKKIKIKRVFDPSLPHILGERDRLVQIFLNLLKNAIEACSEGATITLKTSLALPVSGSAPIKKNRRYAIIEMIDEGPGVDEDIRPYLFTPFFSKKSGGTGLGLPITLHLVQAHEGILEINNRKDGVKGTNVVVYLPYSL
jgi:two-component system nitrogen regulation sensor histidine kinase GlnL